MFLFSVECFIVPFSGVTSTPTQMISAVLQGQDFSSSGQTLQMPRGKMLLRAEQGRCHTVFGWVRKAWKTRARFFSGSCLRGPESGDEEGLHVSEQGDEKKLL